LTCIGETKSPRNCPTRTKKRASFLTARVDSMDSTIVGLLMRFRRQYAEAGHDPLDVVIIASPNVRRMLEIVGMTKQVTILSPASSAAQT
jgi:anti-anti-sigma regulatory factor